MSPDVHIIIPLMKMQHQDIFSHVVFLLADPEPSLTSSCTLSYWNFLAS